MGYLLDLRKYVGHSLLLMVGATTLSNELTSQSDPYYIEGDLTIDAPWSIGTGESVVVLVNGNLNINEAINTTGTGFVAFIVNGNITNNPPGVWPKWSGFRQRILSENLIY